LTELKGGFRVADMEELRKVKKLAIAIVPFPDEPKDYFALEVLRIFDQLNDLSLISNETDDYDYGKYDDVSAEIRAHRRELVVTDLNHALDIPGLNMEFMESKLQEQVRNGISCPKFPAIAFKEVFTKHDVELGNNLPEKRWPRYIVNN